MVVPELSAVRGVKNHKMGRKVVNKEVISLFPHVILVLIAFLPFPHYKIWMWVFWMPCIGIAVLRWILWMIKSEPNSILKLAELNQLWKVSKRFVCLSPKHKKNVQKNVKAFAVLQV